MAAWLAACPRSAYGMGRQAQLRDHAAAKPLPVSALTGLGHRLGRGALGHGRGLVAAAARCLMLCMAWPPMACEAAKQWSLCLHLALQAYPSSPCSLVAALPRLATLSLMQRQQPVCASRRVHLLLWKTPCLMGHRLRREASGSQPAGFCLPAAAPRGRCPRAGVGLRLCVAAAVAVARCRLAPCREQGCRQQGACRLCAWSHCRRVLMMAAKIAKTPDSAK